MLKTITQFCEDNTAFCQGGMRSLIFYRGDEAVKAGAIVRFGRRILVDEDVFLAWVKNGGAAVISGVRRD
ncbi:hypothetical protein [Acidihalobacter aeolianus]|nr:hypothetical protein [Acidihalobacter aeolianus]